MFLDFLLGSLSCWTQGKKQKSKSDIIVFETLFLWSTETRLKAEINPNCWRLWASTFLVIPVFFRCFPQNQQLHVFAPGSVSTRSALSVRLRKQLAFREPVCGNLSRITHSRRLRRHLLGLHTQLETGVLESNARTQKPGDVSERSLETLLGCLDVVQRVLERRLKADKRLANVRERAWLHGIQRVSFD